MNGSENIGGLLGSNTGNLTAGYNTGVIDAQNSTNVGGIVGTNSGTIDQVFTNVMTENGQDQTITGASNVGGIVGNNANGATISNAYTDKNTTIIGATSGLIAGTNGGTISNVYASGTLTGADSTVTNGKDISKTGTDWTKADSYKTGKDTFDFDNTWKIYEDHTNPMLRVFLTKASVSQAGLTYNGTNQLVVDKFVTNNMTNKKDGNAFTDYHKNNALIQGSEMKNAGKYQNWLWSAQIGGGRDSDSNEFDPNNLGYDFTVGNVEIAKKALTAKDFAASIVYGKQDGKDWHIDKSGTLEGVVSGDDVGLNWNGQWSKGKEYVTNQNGRETADAGTYKENMKVTGIGLIGAEAENYTISSEAQGDLTVKQANLEVSLKDISRVYGDLTNKNYGGEFEYKNGTKLVNGDSGLTVTAAEDGAIKDGNLTDLKKTQNVGDYTWTGTLGGVDNLNTNYNVTFTDSATSKVTPADLEVSLKDISRVYGNLESKDYSQAWEYKNGTKLVNGDSGLTVTATSDGAIKEGALTEVKKTQNVGNYTWKGTLGGVDNLNANYNVTFTDSAASKVTPANLEVRLKDISRVYGDLTSKDYSKEFEYKNGTKLVNGDSGLTVTATEDGAIKDGTRTDVKKTQDVGDYTWEGTLSGITNLETNYHVKVNDTEGLTGSAISKVTKAALNLDLNDVNRTYGDTTIKEGGYSLKDYKLVNGDSGTIDFDKAKVKDGGLIANGTKTNDVKEGGYTWSIDKADLTGDGLNLNNYDITVGTGKSYITPKDVSLKDLTASIVYGSTDGIHAGDLSFKDGDIVYDDDVTVSGNVTIRENSEYANNKGNRNTADVGNYDNSLKVNSAKLEGKKAGNYKLVGDANGTITVTPAKLELNLNDVKRTYGDTALTEGSYSFKDYKDQLVNGDAKTGTITLKKAATDEGLITEDRTNDAGNYKWTANIADLVISGFKDSNYDVKINKGNSIVKQKEIHLKDLVADTIYGNKDEMNFGDIKIQDNELVYGDKVSASGTIGIRENSKYEDNRRNRNTADAGTYENSLKVTDATLVGDKAGNYKLVGDANGTITVTPAKLELNLNDVKRTYGDTTITEGSYSLKNYQDKLVNGDSGTISFDPDKGKVNDGGLVANGTKTNDVKKGGYTWSISNDALTSTGLNLNNYDIAVSNGKSYITPREVSLKDLTASIVYGSIDGIHAGDLSFKDGDIVYEDDVTVSGNVAIRESSKYANNKDNRDTADVGNYDSSLKVDNAELRGEKAGNYKLVGDANGTIEVTKAKLKITVGDARTTYGQQFDESQYGYTLSGNTNGDSEEFVKKLIGSVSYTNSATKDGTNGTWTANADTYGNAVGLRMTKEQINQILNNYDVASITNGTATIGKANLHVHTDDQTITVGQKPKYTGTISKLVNGDSEEALGKLIYGIDDARYEQTAGTYIGVIRTVNGKYGELPSSYYKNYEITYDWGNLIVKPVDAPQFDYLFYDTPWDKQRNFRERRAELHFVDGGVRVG